MVAYNPFSLEGKKILVTGASSGIGRAIAIECSKMGAEVSILGRNLQRLENTYKNLLGSNHNMFSVELTSEKAIEDLVKDLEPFDGIVHSAGVINRVPLKLIRGKMFEDLLQINLIAPAILSKYLYKADLIKPEASMVFISSIGSTKASLGNIMYMSSKGGLNSLMKGIALELSAKRIRVNSIEPGMIKTNLTKSLPEITIEKDMNLYPLGRYGQPEEIAFATVFLLSDATKWITGSVLRIDGGISLK